MHGIPADPVHRARRRAGGLALLCLGLATPVTVSATDDDDGRALARETAQLRAELELAGEDVFYLRLDLGRRVLELLLRGVVLESLPTLAVERGTPRVAFWPRATPSEWDRLRYGAGRLEPERERDRLEVLAPEGGTGASSPPPRIPPTAEESISVPSRWRVVFAGGLTLEVRSSGGARHRGPFQRTLDSLSLWHDDWRRATSADAAQRVWLRVQLTAEDAAALYRSLPPDVAFVVRSAGADAAVP